MNYALIENPVLSEDSCLVIGFFENSDLKSLYPALSNTLTKNESTLIDRLSHKRAKAGEWIWQNEIRESASLLLINCGKSEEFDNKHLKKRITDIIGVLIKQGVTIATFMLPPILKADANWQARHMVLQIDYELYQFHDFKTRDTKPHVLKNINIVLKNSSSEAVKEAEAIATGVTLTKNLANLPANHCTPTILGETAKALAQEHDSIKVSVFGPKEQREMGMGALLAVSQGSIEPSCFVEMIYKGKGATDKAPIVLVGKGITFDSGGLSLKPADFMTEMKYDMAGAASVIGTLKACALLELPIQVVGLIACAENLPSGTAVKPGDVITSMSGQTVEILNTDAEGRLVLADALTYAERFNPSLVIDIATLTGAVIIALGSVNSGLMTENEDLAEKILNAAKESDDRCWRLPLDDTYQGALDSPIADMINSNFDRSAGSITAACFLSRFTKKFPWAHLDIAGTAWVSGKNRHATGRPVPLLVQLLSHAANSR